MRNEKLPTIVPSYNLTGQSHNIVAYCISGEKTIYCESIRVVNGWVIMDNLRIKRFFNADIKTIQTVEVGNSEAGFNWDRYGESYGYYGYEEISNRTIPEKAVTVIDSYDYTQKGQLPEWSITDKNTAIEAANKKVLKHNEETRKKNANIFKQIVISVFRNRHYKEFKSIPTIIKKVSRLKWEKWYEEKTKQPYAKNIIEDIAEGIRNRYNELKIEYTGELELDLSDMEKFFEGNIW